MALVLIVQNDGTGNHIDGNYNVTVQINDKVLWQGTVQNFCRPAGWAALLRRCVKLMPKQEF